MPHALATGLQCVSDVTQLGAMLLSEELGKVLRLRTQRSRSACRQRNEVRLRTMASLHGWCRSLFDDDMRVGATHAERTDAGAARFSRASWPGLQFSIDEERR